MSLPKLLCHDGLCNLSSAKCQVNKTLLEYFIQNEITRSGSEIPAPTLVTPEINANLISIPNEDIAKIEVNDQASVDATKEHFFQSQLA